MNGPASGSNLIGCSARELREIKEYIRSLERDLHTARTKVARHRNSRALRLARELPGIRRSPIRALTACLRIVFGPRPSMTSETFRRRGFAALDRRALPTVEAMAGVLHRTVLADVVERCSSPTIVTLRDCGPSRPVDAPGPWIDVGPHDFEVLLAGRDCPTLLVDASMIAERSPWFGVFGTDDMRLNLAMANLVELVRSRRGKVVFTNVTTATPPLLGDFLLEALVVDSLDAYVPTRAQ
jgi:hypothetical protein